MDRMDEDHNEEAPRSHLLKIVGMSCSHCESAVSAALANLDGVRYVSVNVASGTAVIESSRPLDMAAVAAVIDDAGYELQP